MMKSLKELEEVIAVGKFKWSKEQTDAIEKRGYPLLVSAAAGSGKTAVLVERIIRRITDVESPVDVDRLLVVTFTNAAASEMKARIAKRLSEVLEEDPSNENIHRQLALINRSNISTIHSFCLKVIDENFHQVDLDPGYRIADDAELNMIMNDAMEMTLEKYYESGDDIFLNLSDVVGGDKGDTKLEEAVKKIFKFSRSGIDPERWISTSVDKYSDDEEKFIKNYLPLIKEDILMILDEAMKGNETARVLIEGISGFEKPYQTLMDDLKLIENIRDVVEVSNDFDEIKGVLDFKFPTLGRTTKEADQDLKDEMKGVRDQYKKLIESGRKRYFFESLGNTLRMMGEMRSPLKKLCDVTTDFANNFRLLKHERNVVDFNDLEHLALKILTKIDYDKDGKAVVEVTEIAKKYADYFEEILIDEYQDSNDVQENILFSVSRKGSNVFMVGDVKQSIYRFRQAKPALFMEKYRKFTPVDDVNESMSEGRKILLNSNYRSRKEVLSGVNDVFRGIMQLKSGEMDYGDDESLKYASFDYRNPDDGSDDGVKATLEIQLIDATSELEKIENISEEESTAAEEIEELKGIELEARYIAGKIKDLVEKEKFLITDPEDKKRRQVSYRDIVILLRATKKASDIFVNELNRIAVPAFSDSATGYFDSLEIRTMVSLLQTIDNRRQDIPLLASMRSPIFNFTEDDFIRIRKVDPYRPFIECVEITAGLEDGEGTPESSDIVRRKCYNFLKQIEVFREKSRHMEIDEFIWMLMEETAYYEYAGAMPNGIQRQANLRLLFQKATEFVKTSYKGLFNFIQYLNGLKENSSDFGDAKILGESEDVVRIMSIHKSKGLEFPVVFLANAGKGFNKKDQNESLLTHEDEGIAINYIDVERGIKSRTLPKVIIKEKIGRENLAEEMRVLYVAMTRAKEKLFITSAVKNADDLLYNWASEGSFDQYMRLSPIKTLSARNYLDWIMPVVLNKKSMSIFKSQIKQKLNDRIFGNTDDFIIRIINRNDLLEYEQSSQEENESNFYQNEELKNERLKAILNYKYPHLEATKSPSKISVSVIKKRMIEENEEERLNQVEFEKDIERKDEASAIDTMNTHQRSLLRPEFMKEFKGLEASERGTAFHTVMYHINPLVNSIEEIKAEIQRLVDKEIMIIEEANSVNPVKVLNFLRSSLGERFRKAYEDGRLYREEVFYRGITIKEAFEGKHRHIEDSFDDKLTIIGIIDAFFINEAGDGIVLLDYKTDSMKDKDESYLEKKYHAQIVLYADALSAITEMEVKEMYLYSTYIDTEIEVIHYTSDKKE